MKIQWLLTQGGEHIPDLIDQFAGRMVAKLAGYFFRTTITAVFQSTEGRRVKVTIAFDEVASD